MRSNTSKQPTPRGTSNPSKVFHPSMAGYSVRSSISHPRIGFPASPSGQLDDVMCVFDFVGIGMTHTVTLIGSWDGWEEETLLSPVGDAFTIVKALKRGVYGYQYIVDGVPNTVGSMHIEYDGRSRGTKDEAANPTIPATSTSGEEKPLDLTDEDKEMMYKGKPNLHPMNVIDIRSFDKIGLPIPGESNPGDLHETNIVVHADMEFCNHVPCVGSYSFDPPLTSNLFSQLQAPLVPCTPMAPLHTMCNQVYRDTGIAYEGIYVAGVCRRKDNIYANAIYVGINMSTDTSPTLPPQPLHHSLNKSTSSASFDLDRFPITDPPITDPNSISEVLSMGGYESEVYHNVPNVPIIGTSLSTSPLNSKDYLERERENERRRRVPNPMATFFNAHFSSPNRSQNDDAQNGAQNDGV